MKYGVCNNTKDTPSNINTYHHDYKHDIKTSLHFIVDADTKIDQVDCIIKSFDVPFCKVAYLLKEKCFKISTWFLAKNDDDMEIDFMKLNKPNAIAPERILKFKMKGLYSQNDVLKNKYLSIAQRNQFHKN